MYSSLIITRTFRVLHLMYIKITICYAIDNILNHYSTTETCRFYLV